MFEERLLPQDPEDRDLELGYLLSEKKSVRLPPPGFLLALQESLRAVQFPEELVKITYGYLFEKIAWETLSQNLQDSGFQILLPRSPHRQEVELIEKVVQTKLTRLEAEQRNLCKESARQYACLVLLLLATVSFAVGASQSKNNSTAAGLTWGAIISGICTVLSCMTETCPAMQHSESDYKRISKLKDVTSQLQHYGYLLAENKAYSPIENVTPTQIRDQQRGMIKLVDDAITLEERAEREARRQENQARRQEDEARRQDWERRRSMERPMPGV